MASTFGLIIGFKNDIRPIIKFHFRQCFQNMNLFFDTQFAKNTSSLNIRCDDKQVLATAKLPLTSLQK